MVNSASNDTDSLLTNDAFVRSLARRLVRDGADADDASQHTWLQWLRRGPLSPSGARAWVSTVIYNYVIGIRRAAARREARERAGARNEALPSTAEVVAREAARKIVIETLFALDEPWRTTLILHYLEGRSAREIAADCNVPLETVRSRIRRGLALCRARLDRLHPGGRSAWVPAVAIFAFSKPPLGLLFITQFVEKTSGVVSMAAANMKTTAIIALALAGLAVSLLLLNNSTPRETDTTLPESAPAATGGDGAGSFAQAGTATHNTQNNNNNRRTEPTVTFHRDADARGVIKGRIVETGGAPVAGAVVERIGCTHDFLTLLDSSVDASAFTPPGPLDVCTTGVDGQFIFKNVGPNDTWIVGVNLGRPRPAFRILDHAPAQDETVDVGDITLAPARRIRGFIQSSAGKPVRGAVVRATTLDPAIASEGLEFLTPGRTLIIDDGFLGAEPSSNSHLLYTIPDWFTPLLARLPFVTSQSGPDGSFEMDGIADGVLYFYITTPDGIPVVASFQEARDIYSITLRSEENARGKVVTKAGVPVAGAKVCPAVVRQLPMGSVGFIYDTVTTGTDGMFHFRARSRREPMRFAVLPPGATTWTVSHTIPNVEADPTITVDLPVPVLVKVMDAKGVPMDAHLSIFQFAAGSADVVLKSDETGRMEDRHILDLGERYGNLILSDLHISRAMVFHASGEVYKVFNETDSKNDDPWADGQSLSEEPTIWRFGKVRIHAPVRRVAAGTYQIDGLSPGSYQVTANAPGHTTAGKLVDLFAGSEQVTVEIKPAPAFPFTVMAWDGTGAASRPAKNVRITCFAGAHDHSMAKMNILATGRTSQDGSIVFPNAPEKMFLIQAQHPDFATQTVTRTRQERSAVSILLTKGGSISGRVLEGGRPASQTFTLLLLGDRRDASTHMLRTVTGRDGSFQFQNLPPGDYQIARGERLFPQSNPALGAVSTWIDTLLQDRTPCKVVDGETSTVVIDLLYPARPAVRGRVTMQGVALSSASVTLRRPDGNTDEQTTNRDGIYHFGPFDPGTYSLVLRLPDAASGTLAIKSIEVVKGAPFFDDWNIEAGSISGSVHIASGAPAASATLVVRRKNPADASDSFEIRFSAMADGSFEYKSIPAGEYFVYAVAGNERTRPAVITVTDGSSAQVDIRLVQCRSVAGTFDLPSGSPVEFAQIEFAPVDNPDPRAVRKANVDLDARTFSLSGLRPGAWNVTIALFGSDGVPKRLSGGSFQLEDRDMQSVRLHF